MRISSDRRSREAHPDPVAERMVREGAQTLRDGELRVARGLARMHRKRTFLLHGCSSAVQFGERQGLSQRRAHVLLNMGLALEADTDGSGERKMRTGQITSDHAAALGKLFEAARKKQAAAPPPAASEAPRADSASPVDAQVPLIRPDENWFDRATETTPATLRKEIHERVEGHGAREPVRTVSIAARESVVKDFRRAQVIASRRAREVLSDGETLAAISGEYLDRHDPLRTKRRTRWVAPPPDRPDRRDRSGRCDGADPPGRPARHARPQSRYVPAGVFAGLLARSGDRCEFPGCTHRIFLDVAHIVPRKDDGPCVLGNLLRLCDQHHALLDAGRIRVLGWRHGRPVFVDTATGEVFEPRGTSSDAPHSVLGTKPRAPPRPDEERSPGDRPLDGWPPDVRERTPPWGPVRDPCRATTTTIAPAIERVLLPLTSCVSALSVPSSAPT